MSMSPSDRSLRAKVAAHTRWSRETDRTRATAPARAAFDARFPNANARRAYFLSLAAKSAKARRRAS